MNKRQIKKLIFLNFVFLIFISCDPGYYVAINNNSNYDKQIQVSPTSDTLKLFENIKEKELDVGKKVGKISNISTQNYTTVTIPKGQILWIGGGIGGPNSKLNIVLNNDTVYAKKFPCKRKFMGSQYVYIIRD